MVTKPNKPRHDKLQAASGVTPKKGSALAQKELKKVERRKTQTSRDDLAATCIENLRSSVHNSKS